MQDLPSFLHRKSQVGQPPIVATLFESRKPEACGIEKQQYHNPDRIHGPQGEPPAVVLLRFRTYTQASTAMARITTAASRINFDLTDLDSWKPSLVSNAHETTLVHQRVLYRQNLVDFQYQTSGFVKLIRIDRLVTQCWGIYQSEAYGKYADAQFRELIKRYHPAVLWNDIDYPKSGHPLELMAEYYNAVPDGVIDDRFGVKHSDFKSPEYQVLDKISPTKWEECRGLGRSFGYNRAEGGSRNHPPR
jgi:hypothetical protein